MKIVPFITLAGFCLFFVNVGDGTQNRYLEIKNPVFMPKLSQEEILYFAETGEYDELLIKGGISAGGMYEIHYRIFGNGTGVLSEAVATEFTREHMIENDYKYYPDGPPIPEEYIEMIESLPEGTYMNSYISNLTKDDILGLLTDLGDGSLPIKDIKSKNYDPGFGMGFGLALYIDGKAVEYYGTTYEPNDDDVDVEILYWLENKLIPLFKEKGEITDLRPSDILDYIPDELVGKYSFIEIRRD
jgi:hypothetical protein